MSLQERPQLRLLPSSRCLGWTAHPLWLVTTLVVIVEPSSRLMEEDSETHGQTLDCILGNPAKGGGIVGARGSGTLQENTQKWLAWFMGTQSLNQQPVSLQGTDLGPLHMCDSCVAWSICGTPGSRSRAIPGALTGSWELIPYTGSPCPAWIQGKGLVLWQLDMLCLLMPMRGLLLSFWVDMEEGWTEWKQRGGGEGKGRKGGRGGCSRDVK